MVRWFLLAFLLAIVGSSLALTSVGFEYEPPSAGPASFIRRLSLVFQSSPGAGPSPVFGASSYRVYLFGNDTMILTVSLEGGASLASLNVSIVHEGSGASWWRLVNASAGINGVLVFKAPYPGVYRIGFEPESFEPEGASLVRLSVEVSGGPGERSGYSRGYAYYSVALLALALASYLSLRVMGRR